MKEGRNKLDGGLWHRGEDVPDMCKKDRK